MLFPGIQRQGKGVVGRIPADDVGLEPVEVGVACQLVIQIRVCLQLLLQGVGQHRLVGQLVHLFTQEVVFIFQVAAPFQGAQVIRDEVRPGREGVLDGGDDPRDRFPGRFEKGRVKKLREDHHADHCEQKQRDDAPKQAA